MLDERCANRVISGAGLGAAVGAAVGSAYGSWEAVNYIPGFAYKIRHVGRTTLGSAALFGLFLGAGSLLQCGRR